MRSALVSARRALASLVVAAMVACLAACGSSGAAEEVRTTVDNTFAAFKDPASADISSYVDDETSSLLTDYGVNVNDFLASAFKHLAYEIQDVQVDGDQATVKLSISNVNLDDAMDAALEDFDAWTDTDEAATAYTDGGEAALYQKLFELLYARIDTMGESLVTNEVELKLQRTEDEAWDVTPEGNEDFYAALYGGATLDLG